MAHVSTKELFTRRALDSGRDEDAVAWAVGQMPDHPPLPNLAALASLSGLLNHFEVEDLLRRALAELGLREPPKRETYELFLRECAEAVIQGALTPREACARLADAHGGDMERRELHPFWLISMAMADLEAGDKQYYYPGLTLQALEELVRKEAGVLLASLEARSGNAS